MRMDTLDNERLLIPTPNTSAARRGVLLYPHSYAVGMSSLATHTLYAELNATGEMLWERAFVDPARDSTRSPALCSLESRALLRDFEAIAITSSYELDWPAIPAALESGGVPPLRENRPDGPIVIAGGPAISAAPLPLAEIYDVAYIGEIEPAMGVLREALAAGSREETLERLAGTRGFYVPELQGRPEAGGLVRRCAMNLDEFDTTSVILTPEAEFANRFLVEIGRGCRRSCSFCLARRLYRPQRWRSVGRIVEAVRRGLEYTNDVGLIAAAVSDYPDLAELCGALEGLSADLRVSTSSVRLESATDELLRLLARGGQHTVTFAPEAATERLRHAIGKGLAEDELFAAVERAAAAELTRIRLYFMIGLPTETAEDREEITALARRLTAAFPRLHFRCNVGVFSPRPHTAFEREALPPTRELRNWLSRVQKSLKSVPHVEVSTDSARWAGMQAALSRSDERLGRALAKRPSVGFTELVRSLEAEGLDYEGLLGRVEEGAEMGWKVVDMRCEE